jgi:hypothetical protein
MLLDMFGRQSTGPKSGRPKTDSEKGRSARSTQVSLLYSILNSGRWSVGPAVSLRLNDVS